MRMGATSHLWTNKIRRPGLDLQGLTGETRASPCLINTRDVPGREEIRDYLVL